MSQNIWVSVRLYNTEIFKQHILDISSPHRKESLQEIKSYQEMIGDHSMPINPAREGIHRQWPSRERALFGISQKKEQEVKEGAHWKASLIIPQCSGSLSSIFGKKAVITYQTN